MPVGGASFLVDALKLATILGAEDPELADFCWDVPIDHSEPNFPQGERRADRPLTAGAGPRCARTRTSCPCSGPDEAAQYPFVETWGMAVAEARTTGPRFRLEAGQMICVDNYRMLHGREAYVDVERKVVSIWGWTTPAVAIPDIQLNITEPVIPEPLAS